MDLQGLSLIGSGRGENHGTRFRAANPETGQTLEPDFHTATAADVDRAISLASDASRFYGRLSGKLKGAFLRQISLRLGEISHRVVARAHLETALGEQRLRSEMERTRFQLNLFAGLVEEGSWVDARIDHGDPRRTPVPKPDIRSMQRPLGPVAVFGSSNFPLAFSVAGGDTASALAAGCPVVVKAHPCHPGTSELVAAAIQNAVIDRNLDAGVFSLLFDHRYDVGIRLVGHPGIKAVGFTGSRRGGRSLMEIAAARPEPIPVFAEMSSVNPVFLLAGALRDRAPEIAGGLFASLTLGAGQFCTNPGLVVVQDSPGVPAFLEELKRLTQESRPGIMLSGDICSAYNAGIERLTRTQGVRLLAPAAPQDPSGTFTASAVLFSTDAKTFSSNRDLMLEVFGPCAIIVLCDRREDLMSVCHSLEGQLTVTIHANDADLAASNDLLIAAERKAGRLILNGYPTGVEVCHAMVHGGPYPATSDIRWTSVGTRAIHRFTRPVCFQNFSEESLPDELKDKNPLRIRRLVDGERE